MPQHLWADGCRALVRQLGLAALLASAAGPVTAASTFVAGSVFQMERGRPSPLAKVRVIARATDTKEILAATKTDARGRYELSGYLPAKVSFSARKHGYFVKTAGGRPDSEIVLECTSADPCGNLDFEMGRAAVVSGRVVDDFGEPLESVEVFMAADDAGNSRTRVAGATQTDDRGLFRISGVKPGRYRVAAKARYVYSDNTQYRGEAALFEVDEGGEVSGIRIVLAPAKADSFHVSGKLTGADLNAERFHWVELRTAGRSGDWTGMSQMTSHTVGGDGSFAFPGVHRGRYVLSYRQGNSTTGRRMLGVIEVNSDISGLILSPLPLTGVVGRVRFETGAPPRTISLAFVSKEDLISPRVQAFAPDFEFERGDFLPGSYRVRAASRDYYLKELRERGHAVSFRDFELRAGDIVQIEAVLADDFGYLHGHIRQPRAGEAEAASGTHFRVGLRSEDETRSVLADQNGRFAFLNVIPGSYRICAWSELVAADVMAEKVWNQAGSAVRAFDVEPGTEIEIDLTAVR